jgi:hypothetical protein
MGNVVLKPDSATQTQVSRGRFDGVCGWIFPQVEFGSHGTRRVEL